MGKKPQQRFLPVIRPHTEALFSRKEFPFDLPDEETYNREAAKRGLFKIEEKKVPASTSGLEDENDGK